MATASDGADWEAGRLVIDDAKVVCRDFPVAGDGDSERAANDAEIAWGSGTHTSRPCARPEATSGNDPCGRRAALD